MLMKSYKPPRCCIHPSLWFKQYNIKMYKAKKWTVKRVINTNNIIMDDFNIPLLDQVEKKRYRIYLLIKIWAPKMCGIPEYLM